MYIGVNDKSKTINQIFIGVNDKAKLIDNAFIGVNNIAEQLIKKIDFPTYTGSHAVFGDLNRGRMELYESGTLVMPAGWEIDIFVVGGGARGGQTKGSSTDPTGGGGGGYTKTIRNFWARNQEKYDVYVGGSDGNTAIKHKQLGDVIVGLHGKYWEVGQIWFGGDGGSGGGDAGLYKESSNYNGGDGGSDGKDGQLPAGRGGRGQGTTTRMFGESNGTLYAGGGGGGAGDKTGNPGAGGLGGGGTGGRGTIGISGTPNTGGGGGGARFNSTTGVINGGSGIVIIRWGY